MAANGTHECRIPSDFPRSVHLGALPGAQPKLLAVLYQGKFYTPGDTPPERLVRWKFCDDLVTKFATKDRESSSDKRHHVHELSSLIRYLETLIKTNSISVQEARWILLKVAAELTRLFPI